MPKALHRKLMRQARKKGYTGERREAYVYGTLEKVKSRHLIKQGS